MHCQSNIKCEWCQGTSTLGLAVYCVWGSQFLSSWILNIKTEKCVILNTKNCISMRFTDSEAHWALWRRKSWPLTPAELQGAPHRPPLGHSDLCQLFIKLFVNSILYEHTMQVNTTDSNLKTTALMCEVVQDNLWSTKSNTILNTGSINIHTGCRK